MKQLALSIGMLLSWSMIHCMDGAQKVTFKTALEQKDENGDTILHHTVKHLEKLYNIDILANPAPFEDEFIDKNLRRLQSTNETFASEEKIQLTRLEALLSECVLRKALADENVATILEYKTKLETKIVDTIRNLHGLGFNLDVQNRDGQTALFLAAWHKAPCVVENLLMLGANPNISDTENNSPLKSAVYRPSNERVIKLLLKYNADASDFFCCTTSGFALSHHIAQTSPENLSAFLEYFKRLHVHERDELATERSRREYSSVNGINDTTCIELTEEDDTDIEIETVYLGYNS